MVRCVSEPARTHGSVRAHVRARTCAVVRRVSELVRTRASAHSRKRARTRPRPHLRRGASRLRARAHARKRTRTRPRAQARNAASVRSVAHEKSAGAHPKVWASTVRLCHLGFQRSTVEPFSNPFAFDSFSPERAQNCVVLLVYEIASTSTRERESDCIIHKS